MDLYPRFFSTPSFPFFWGGDLSSPEFFGKVE